MILRPERDGEAEFAARRVAEYPAECCGVIISRRRASASSSPAGTSRIDLHARDPAASSARRPRTAYYMDPTDLLRIGPAAGRRLAPRRDLPLPLDTGAYFSETDRPQALMRGEPTYPEATYVVVSVVGGEVRRRGRLRWERAGQGFPARGRWRHPQRAPGRGHARVSMRCSTSAEQVIPGGVNSPVRAFRGVGGDALLRRPRRGGHARGRRRAGLPRLRRVLGAARFSATPRPRSWRR